MSPGFQAQGCALTLHLTANTQVQSAMKTHKEAQVGDIESCLDSVRYACLNYTKMPDTQNSEEST